MNSNRNLILVVIYVIFIIAGCNNKTAEEYYKQAKYLDEIGKPKKAYNVINRAIKKQPKNHLYYILKAETRYHGWATQKGSIENVMSDYNKALDYKPYSVDVFKSRWKYFEFKGDDKNMLIDLERVLKIDSTNFLAWLKVGEINFQYNDTAKGYYCFNKAQEYANNKDSVMMFLADAEFKTHMFKKAKNRYLSLLNKSNKVAFYRYTNLSMAYWNMNNRDSACFYFQYVNKNYLYDKLLEISTYCK